MFRTAVVLAMGGLGACQAELAPPASLVQLEALFVAPPLGNGETWLLAGEYEVTRAEWLGFASSGGNLPQAWVDFGSASNWAIAQGFRLPTLLEWRWLALGRNSGRSAWNRSATTHDANVLELGFHRPLPGGVFERRSGPFGGWDFLGNVWEWVSDPQALPGRVTACGGGFAHDVRGSSAEDSPDVRLRHLTQGEKADDLGFRLVTEAIPWLQIHALPLWENPLWKNRVEQRFQSWHGPTRKRLAAQLRSRGVATTFCAALAGTDS